MPKSNPLRMATLTLSPDREHREFRSNLSENRTLYARDRIQVPGIATFGQQRAKDGDQSFPLHYHKDRFEFHYLIQGSPAFQVGEESYTMKAGDVFVTFPNELHQTGGQTIIRRMYWFSIEDKTPLLGLDETQSNLLLQGLKNLKNRIIPMGSAAGSLLEESYRHVTSPLAEHRLYSGAQMAAFLCKLIESDRQLVGRALSPEIRQALDFIEENRHRHLTLEEVAEHCHLSTSYFKHRFKDETGNTPALYIQQKRIDCAKELLKSGRSVTQTAHELDFASSNYFSVVFRRVTLMTPTQYLQREEDAQ